MGCKFIFVIILFFKMSDKGSFGIKYWRIILIFYVVFEIFKLAAAKIELAEHLIFQLIIKLKLTLVSSVR